VTAAEVVAILHAEPSGNGHHTGRCPAHLDSNPSLSISEGDDGKLLLHCHAGCTFAEVMAALRNGSTTNNGASAPGPRRIIATYPYKDERGETLYEAVRYEPKDFWQRRPDGRGGWHWNLDGVRRVLFNLPALHGQRSVFIGEGEKDVEALRYLGLVATSNAGGAGKWDERYTEQLLAAGIKRVTILPDNDTAGEEHAVKVARSCAAAGLKVKIVRLPGLPPKGDVSDWLAAGHTAADLYERHFGRRPRGIWLGECGYIPGADELLREAAIRYFFVDTHGVLYADHQPAYGIYAPIYCPTGVAAFARDTESSEQVWSAKHGYPGDPHYRDFYRDIGFDLPADYIGPHIHPEGHRMATGFKYHAITHDKLHDKWVYDPDVARGKAGLHASHFRGNMEKQAERLAGQMDRPPIIVSPYDAALYGHWWYEGPVFLGDLFRQLHHDQSTIESITPVDYLERHPTNQVATPSASSWGAKGYNEQWLNETNAWTWRHVHVAGERMTELARNYSRGPSSLTDRALKQAARELMLAQSSDWPFIMSTGTTVPYATRRFNEHIIRFTRLYEDLREGKVDEPYLASIEAQDNIFPQVDYRIYAT